ncbi:Jerky Protein-like [Manis pentadactyla]|nr:Jerky Protein-like [Manis pentadactyla]
MILGSSAERPRPRATRARSQRARRPLRGHREAGPPGGLERPGSDWEGGGAGRQRAERDIRPAAAAPGREAPLKQPRDAPLHHGGGSVRPPACPENRRRGAPSVRPAQRPVPAASPLASDSSCRRSPEAKQNRGPVTARLAPAVGTLEQAEKDSEEAAWEQAALAFDAVVRFAERQPCFTAQEVGQLRALRSVFVRQRQVKRRRMALRAVVKLEAPQECSPLPCSSLVGNH